MEGKLCFKIDWASCGVEKKFTVFTLLYFVFEGNFQVQAPRGAYIWRGDVTEGFVRYKFGGAYIWRGLYMEGVIFGSLRYVIRKWHIALWGYMKQSPSTVYKYALS